MFWKVTVTSLGGTTAEVSYKQAIDVRDAISVRDCHGINRVTVERISEHEYVKHTHPKY